MTLNWLLLGGMAVCSCGAFTCAVLYARRRFHGGVRAVTVDDEDYADPKNRVPVGPARRRTTKSTHVPIRFTPQLIAEVKRLAQIDRKTVSTWIRDAVEAETARRQPCWPRTVGFGGQNTVWPDNSPRTVGVSDTNPQEQ